ncbi:uncharacterized protein I303_100857 [Kwoniella dejecticola CBS 10117]|uniref:Thioredoxin domain-containing protein n=1 Tax=Kwoniella dejecticola CBS 10117 TaxID=1296121 RepID=A0A1A6AG71_9TREE|nr:uncharacterized protein I303_00860 [Kwoniella dejecticola CBS 10117]OBR89038.1 hypothetical protein I303_00860 [Kwoniella dejecticola CBS 10117]
MSLRLSPTSASRIVKSNRVFRPSVASRSITSLARPTVQIPLPKQYRMASVLQATAKAAHSAVASLASAAPIKVGDAVPDVDIRINDLEDKVNFSKLQGKNILVLVPGAFSPTCSSQVPGYLEQFSTFQSKGVKDIYVVAVNDMFVVNAWKEKLAGEKNTVKFAADDTSALASKLGLVLDGQAIFGGPRLQRGALVIEDGKVLHVAVEPSPGEVTVSHADEVLKSL